MLSLKDCLDFCDLEASEVEILAAYEGIPLVIAAQLGHELVKTPEGLWSLHCMLLEKLGQALVDGDIEAARRYSLSYQNLQCTYPLPSTYPINDTWIPELNQEMMGHHRHHV